MQRRQEGQWRRVSSALESINKLTKRIHEALNEVAHSNLLKTQTNSGFERMILDRVVREIDLLEEQQHNILSQIAQVTTNTSTETPRGPQRTNGAAQARTLPRTQYATEIEHNSIPAEPRQLSPLRQGTHSAYNQRFYQLNQVDRMPVDE
jgi:protein required for attachment to host cells